MVHTANLDGVGTLRRHGVLRGFGWIILLIIGVSEACGEEMKLTILETGTGIEFGLWGPDPVDPRPTLFILAGSIEETLGDPYFRQSGNLLAAQGYLCVSIDIPGHGKNRGEDPDGLEGWRSRVDRGEDFVAETNRRLSAVLDTLIAEGLSDPARVAACGTSRGGFLALHFAAADTRVKCVATFAPVTDLTALREFAGTENHDRVASLSASRRADDLVDCPTWIIIGDRDERVGTDNAIALARGITASALARGLNPAVELHVVPEPKGHTTPDGAAAQAAAWIINQMGGPARRVP